MSTTTATASNVLLLLRNGTAEWYSCSIILGICKKLVVCAMKVKWLSSNFLFRTKKKQEVGFSLFKQNVSQDVAWLKMTLKAMLPCSCYAVTAM